MSPYVAYYFLSPLARRSKVRLKMRLVRGDYPSSRNGNRFDKEPAFRIGQGNKGLDKGCPAL